MKRCDYISLFEISYEWLRKIFPFYLIINSEDCILDSGPGFMWMNTEIPKGDSPSTHFKSIYSFKSLTFEFILNDEDEETIFRDLNDLFTLKGKAYFFSSKSLLLFLPSISIHHPETVKKIGLQNFEPFDQTFDMIFLKALQESESQKSLNLIQNLQKKARDLAEENKKITSGRVCLNGHKLKQLRQDHLMSVDMFVKKSQEAHCYISKSTLKRAELGTKIYFRTALDIAKILKIDVYELIAHEEDTQEKSSFI